MSTETQNLGTVKAIFSQSTPPTNTSVIWEDTSITSGPRHKYYDFILLNWQLLVVEAIATPDATPSVKGKMKLYTDFTGNNTDGTVTQAGIKAEIASKVAGLLDLRGAYDASSNLFPTAPDGSGTAGAVLTGDFWIVKIGGTLGGEVVVPTQSFFAKVNTPGQDPLNWAILPVGSGTTPNLQQVLDEDNNSTTVILLNDASVVVTETVSGDYAQYDFDRIETSNGILQFPTSAGTLALLSDITGGVFTKDANDNVFYDGASPTLGINCYKNIFYKTAGTITLGEQCSGNIFEPNDYNINLVFGIRLKHVTVRGGNYPASPSAGTLNLTAGSYGFIYNQNYPAEIFVGANGQPYHKYYDAANNRYVITLLLTPFTVSYIGGGGSGTVTSVNSGINISVDNTNPAAPIINSLSDRYKTTSLSSITIGNGSRTFTVDANLSYIALQEVLIVYDTSNHMHGTVTSYSGTTLIVDVKHHTGGPGPFTSWVINLDGVPIDAITGAGVANEIGYFISGQVMGSLSTATYPSLTELARVKNLGSQAVGISDTNILTNKRITARTGTIGNAGATPTINTDNVDIFLITAQTVDITDMSANLSGTPTEGQTLWIAITGTAARTITWNGGSTKFESSGYITLPTTTVGTTRLDVAFIWNSVTSKWRCVGVA